MGLLDFDVGKIANNDAFQLGMNIMANNTGHYGQTAPAIGQGFQDFTRQRSLMAQQARANAQALRYEQEQKMRQEQWLQQQEQYKQQQQQLQTQKQAVAKQYPNLANLPKHMQTAQLAQMYPKSATYGTTPHFGPKAPS